jgi:prepilin-type N-terminal cleavage/methylation domain-containing protein
LGDRERIKLGFTLTEVLVVVLLLGILLGIAAPRMTSSFYGLQLSTGSRDIIALSRYAGQRAVLYEVCYRINFDRTNGKYWLTYQKEPLADPGNYERLHTSLGRIHSLPEKVNILRIIHPSGNYSHITFYPDGTADETRIYLTNDKGKGYVLSTSRLVGRITMEEINAM